MLGPAGRPEARPMRHQFYWSEAFRVWFPGGPSDPTLALIGVQPIDAEYWDNGGSNKLKCLFEAAKAYVKGEKPDVGDPDQHTKTSLLSSDQNP
ncbi:MAG TPA: pyridoxamine 5'-phosphate oxidase family protein [Bryobacteraceae bacterium]